MAANALSVAWTCCTFLSWSWTVELSPPWSEQPHVTMPSPPQHHTARAESVLATLGSCATAVRWSPSSIPAACKGCERSVSIRPSSVTSLRNPRPKLFCASFFNSPTVYDWGIVAVSLRPLGNDTLSRSIVSKTSRKHQKEQDVYLLSRRHARSKLLCKPNLRLKSII